MARRAKPSILWNDHGTNFVGAAKEIKELYEFLRKAEAQSAVSDFCSGKGIEWRFTPEHAPHFGCLWEAVVKSFKSHLHRVVGDMKVTCEELSTVLAQIEACLNSRPLVETPHPENGIEVWTPGHFLIRAPLESLPDGESTQREVPLLQRWNHCQALTQHLCKR